MFATFYKGLRRRGQARGRQTSTPARVSTQWMKFSPFLIVTVTGIGMNVIEIMRL